MCLPGDAGEAHLYPNNRRLAILTQNYKLCVKKIYCGTCRRLVDAREDRTDKNAKVLCRHCGQLLYQWMGTNWKAIKGVAAKPEKAAAKQR